MCVEHQQRAARGAFPEGPWGCQGVSCKRVKKEEATGRARAPPTEQTSQRCEAYSGNERTPTNRLCSLLCCPTHMQLCAISFDKNERRLVTAGSDGSVFMWNFNNGSKLKEFRHDEEKEELTAVLFVADEKRESDAVYAAGWNSKVNAEQRGTRDRLEVTWLSVNAAGVNVFAFGVSCVCLEPAMNKP